MTETILFGIKVTGTDQLNSSIKGLNANLVSLTNQIKANENALKLMAKDGKENSKEYQNLTLKTRLLKEEKKDLTKTLQQEINVQRAVKGSLSEVNAELARQTRILKFLDIGTKEYTDGAKRVKALTDAQRRHNEAIGKGSTFVGEYAKGFKEAFTKIGMAIGAVMVVWQGLNRIANFFSGSLDAYVKQQEAVTALTTALGKQSIALERQASVLQSKTKFGDEEIIQGQSYLAMLGLTERQIKDVTPLILDFAAAKKMDLKTASDLVAKSIGSETNALKRYGIDIEGAAGSQERLESAMNSLNNAFGGQAEAIAKVDGGLTQFKNAIDDSKEIVGELVASILGELLPALTQTISQFNNLYNNQKRLREEMELTTIGGAKAATIYEALAKVYEEKGESMWTVDKNRMTVIKALQKNLQLTKEDTILASKVFVKFAQDMQMTDEVIVESAEETSKEKKDELSQQEKDYAEYIKKIKELEDKLVTDKKTVIWNNYQNQLIIIDKLLISEEEKDRLKLLEYENYLKETEAVDQEYLDNQKKLDEQVVKEQADMFDKMDEQAEEQSEEDIQREKDKQAEILEAKKQAFEEFYSMVNDLVDFYEDQRLSKIEKSQEEEAALIEHQNKAKEKYLKDHYDEVGKQLKEDLENNLITQTQYDQLTEQREAKLAKDQEELEREQKEKTFQLEKAAFEKEKKLKIGIIAAEGAVEIARINSNPAVNADITQIMRGVLTAAAILRTGLQIGMVAAQEFALGGKVQSGHELPCYPKSGDNTLALVKPGEVILNKNQQSLLGGSNTFKRIGVPGFADGGLVAPQPTTPNINVTVDNKSLAASLNSIKVVNVATDTTGLAARVYNEETADDI